MTLAVVATLSVSALYACVSGAAEPFYERRLEEGLLAAARADYVAAVRDLEIACFGLLAEPEKLAACWAHLALAQAGGGDRQGFAVTAGRLLELERRLGAYSEAELTPAARLDFEQRLRLWVPGEDSRTAPAPTAGISDPIEDRIEVQIEEARELLASSRDRESLGRTFTEMLVIANTRPEHRELQLVVAEMGYRLRRWQDAVTYFQRGGVAESDPPERRFYYAVALLETGDREAAARVLERCLPRLQKTEFVRDIASRALGPSDG